MNTKRVSQDHAIEETTAGAGGPASVEPPGFHPPPARVVLVGGALIVVMALFLCGFSGAFGNPEPRQIPVAAVAPTALVRRLEANSALDVRASGRRSQARTLVEDRSVDGALIWDDPAHLQLDIASGGGRPVAVALGGIANALAQNSGAHLSVFDLAPLAQADSSGAVEFFAIVFITIAASVGAGLLGRLLGPVSGLNQAAWRVLMLTCYTALLSAVFAVVVDAGFGALVGHPGPLFLVFWGYTTAVCLAVTGIAARLGTAATLAVVLVMVILGNTSAGGPVPRPLLNGFFSSLTPVFPQGAGLTMVRGVQYFGGYGLTGAAPTLTVWGGAGLLLLTATALRRFRAASPAIPSR